MGGAWLCTHIWQHFDFTGDRSYLEKTYHILRGSMEFFLGFMADKDGYKVTSPSLSPENIYRLPNGEEGSICSAPTMDVQLLYNLLEDFLAAAEVLEKDDPAIVNRVREYRAKLSPLKIGKHGQL
jgi:alpha-L-fucosidase 2